MIYDVGDAVDLRREVRNSDHVLVSGATVTLVVTRPDGSVLTPGVNETAPGVYDADPVPLTQSGPWRGHWMINGPVTDVGDVAWYARDPAPGLYVDLSTVKAALGKITEDVRDDLVTAAINAACRQIDRWCSRRFWLDPAPTPRVVSTAGRLRRATSGRWYLELDDIGSLTGAAVEGGGPDVWTPFPSASWVPADEGWPTTVLAAPTAYGHPFGDAVRITARWGWPAVPDEIVQAALIQSIRLYRRKDSPQGVLGSADWGVIRVGKADPDVDALIAPYVIAGFA